MVEPTASHEKHAGTPVATSVFPTEPLAPPPVYRRVSGFAIASLILGGLFALVLLIMAAWAVCLVWSVGGGYLLGYRRPAADVTLILGFPDWVFWTVVLPWAACLAFSVWFCFAYMADDDLGKDPDESDGHA